MAYALTVAYSPKFSSPIASTYIVHQKFPCQIFPVQLLYRGFFCQAKILASRISKVLATQYLHLEFAAIAFASLTQSNHLFFYTGAASHPKWSGYVRLTICQTDMYFHSFNPSSIKSWNNLPCALLSIPCLNNLISQ